MNMDKENAQAQIRELIEARVRAVDAKDLETLMSNHAPDVLSFDVVNDLQVRGADAVRGLHLPVPRDRHTAERPGRQHVGAGDCVPAKNRRGLADRPRAPVGAV